MSRIVALDLDSTGAYVAVGSARKGQIVIERAVALPDDFSALTIATAGEFGKKLKDLLKQSGIAPGPAVVLVGRDKLVIKEVKYPNVKPVEEPAIVRFQAVKDLNESADDLAIDYLPIGTTAEGKRANVFFLKKEYVKAYKAICEAAGLKLNAITPRAYAVIESYQSAIASGTEPPDSPDDTVAVIYPAGRGAEFAVIRNNGLIFSRPIPPNSLQSEAAFVGDVKRNLTVMGGQVPGGVAAVYLAEGDSGGWAGRLQENLAIPVRTFDPLAGSLVAASVPSQFAGRFAATAGAIRLTSKPGPLPINFVTPRAPKAEVDQGRTKILLAALAATVIIGGLFAAGMWMVSSAEDEVVSLARKKETAGEELLRTMTNAKRVEAAKEFMSQQVRIHDELYDWTEMMPNVSDVRVTEMHYKLNALPTVKERKTAEQKLAPVAALPGAVKPATPIKSPTTVAKTPAKPVAQVEFKMQTNDSKQVEAFVMKLSQEKRYYDNPKSEGGQASGTGRLNQSFNVKMGILSRKPEQYTRKLNVTLPKQKPKVEQPDDEFGGFAPITAEGVNR